MKFSTFSYDRHVCERFILYARCLIYLSFFVQELRQAIDDEKLAPSKEKLLLTVAVPATKDYIDGGFDVPEIAK